MNAINAEVSMQPPAKQPTAGQRRRLFQLLAELLEWQTSLIDAVAISARNSSNTMLTQKIINVEDRLKQGQSLSQAFAVDEIFWGTRTVKIITRLGEQQPAIAFRRLATGAGEHPLKRPFITCFGMGGRRRLLNSAALIAAIAIWLPVLPYRRQASGDIVVHVFGKHRSLMQGIYDTNLQHGLNKHTIAIQQEWQDVKTDLEQRTGDGHIASCITSYLIATTNSTSSLEFLSQLQQLAPSPVPAVWLIRKLRVEHLKANADYLYSTAQVDGLGAGYRQLHRSLSKNCPEIQP